MATRGSGTLLAGSPWNLRTCCWGGPCICRIACLGPRPAGSPRARRPRWLPPVCRSSARRTRCEPAHAPRSPCHPGGRAGFLAALASWAASLPLLKRQLPSLLRAVLPHLSLPEAHAPSLRAATAAALMLADPSWELPTWQDVLAGALPAARSDDADSLFLSGDAARAALEGRLFQDLSLHLDPSALALLESQQGPFAGRVLPALPTSPELTAPSHLFRSVLLRRLRLPLPVTENTHRRLDSLGDRSRAGVLRSRAHQHPLGRSQPGG